MCLLFLGHTGAWAAQLSVATSQQIRAVNLTLEGSADWMHFGLTTDSSINRKNGVPALLGYSPLSVAAKRFSSNTGTRSAHSWSDGKPVATANGFAGGVYFAPDGSGYTLTAPADSTTRQLTVHLGGFNSSSTLELSLSDGSAAPVDINMAGPAVYHYTVVITYSAASTGAVLTARHVKSGASGNAALQAATLAYPSSGGTLSLPFTDDFSDGSGDGWTVVDDSSDAGNWQVVNQEFRQLNRVENVNARNGTYQLGTFAHLPAGNTLTDLRFAVSTAFIGDGTAEDVGVLFRYVDTNNYYRLALNSRHGYTRLEKRVAGAFSTLAVNSRGYRPGEQLDLVIETRGSNHFVWINNDPVFAVSDASHPAGTVALYAKDATRFDNVSLTTPGSSPAIVLSSPLAFSTTSANTLSASALATNVPAGGSVQFLLNGGNAIVDTSAPFTATFNNVPPGNHEVIAILRNAANAEVARDTNTVIGATGEKLLAVGDSITNGSGDAYASDNISVLERFIGFQGPQPNLISALDNTRGGLTPTLVFNEGIGGDETFDAAFTRIASILERHTAVDRVLIGLGTNDAFVPVPAGLGCNGSACNGTFKGNLQTLVNRIIWQNYPTNTVPSGIEAVVALAPPAFTSTTPWTTAANNLIRDYNQVIQNEITGIQVGPNLFDHFMPSSSATTHLRSLFADTLHPNGLGYQVVAALWHNSLEPASPVSLPFTLAALTSSVSSNKPQQDLIETGDLYRLNTAHTITGFPPVLADGRWIKTNNNTSNRSASYLSFTVDRPVDVYIAYDGGASARPNWMSSFTNTGLNVTTTDANGPIMRLYVRSFPAGTITLGGNKAAGSVGANTNYFAIIVEN